MKKILSLIVLLPLLAQPNFAQIINVPADQPTIQAAINASVDGDTVLVDEGTYFENINFKSKAITVASHFLIDGDQTHIDRTIINGSQPSHPDSGSVVFIEDSKDSNSVLCGFTITGGTGTKTGFGELGGGIAIGFSGAKIEHNKIINNSTVHNGAGITIGYPQHPIIIRKNYIAHNIAKDTKTTNGGGGMMIAYDYEAYVLVAENVIEYNISYSSKGGGVGGGISMQHSNSVIRNNLIAKNIAYEGAGMHIHDGENPNKPTIINNTIVYNTASNEGGGLNVSWQNPSASPIRNCIIWGNTALVGSQIFEYSGGYDVSVEYTNVEGGFEGNGNINLDPKFADTTLYYLDPLSPCVDAGHPNPRYNDVGDLNNPGFPLFPALGSLRNDMGAYGGNSKMFFTKMNRTINVPNDQPTIQTGIDAAVDGDTVLVADGTYFENINFIGKAITVASKFIIDKDTSHISKTIIDGSQLSHPDSGSVVCFISGEDTNSILCGMTLQSGSGTFGIDGNFNWRVGGAIHIENSGATIKNNIFRNNSIVASATNYVTGGGIDCFELPNDRKLIVQKNIFYNNQVKGINSWGGAINCESVNGNLLITENIIENNRVNGTAQGNGGGISLLNGLSDHKIISNNYIINNNVIGGADDGGGIFAMNCRVKIFNNIITKNNCSGNAHGRGGGISVGYWSEGSGNPSEMKASVINNTIVKNYAKTSGGGIYVNNMYADFINNIIRENLDPKNLQINIFGTTYEHVVEYSNIEGGFTGIGNIDADPNFCDSIFCLLPYDSSPSIDGGNPDPSFNDRDRNPLFPARGTLRNDMGAFGGPNSQWSEMTIIPDDPDSITAVNENFAKIPEEYSLSQNYPNPFNPSTTIKYQLPAKVKSETIPTGRQAVNVKLIVFDILGREVTTLVNQRQNPGNYEVTWDATDVPSGVYFYKLTAGDPESSSGQVFVEVKKMILLK